MPVYVVSRVQIRDAEAMRRYVTEAPATVAAFGGRYHFRGSNVEALEGAWEHDRLVVLEFPTRADALAWYHSDLYRPPSLHLGAFSAYFDGVSVQITIPEDLAEQIDHVATDRPPS